MKNKDETKLLIEAFKRKLQDQTTKTTRKEFFFSYLTAIDNIIPDEFPCKRCHTLGQVDHWKKDGTKELCHQCAGAGHYLKPYFIRIFENITTQKAGPWRVKSKCPSQYDLEYFAWRLYRFHSGKDVTLPMTAHLMVGDNPYSDYVDTMTMLLSYLLNKHHSAGATRWSRALFGETIASNNMPPSAFEGGPVADENKPEIEALELK